MTELLKIDPQTPDPAIIERAADLIQRSELVVIPTETVYGLGANALDSAAIEKIYAAKGRPSYNPLIVHVSNVDQAKSLVINWPKAVDELVARFWPGPLTIVLPKAAKIPSITTAGGSTVAIRMPNHRVALALIEKAGVPIAAPSANRSTMLSPTTAEHVQRSLDESVAMILDAGPATGGIESTVVDLSGAVPVLLRPGLISPDELREILPDLQILAREVLPSAYQKSKVNSRSSNDSMPHASPGMMDRHYAPHAEMECWKSDSVGRVQKLCSQGKKVGWLKFNTSPTFESQNLIAKSMPATPDAYAEQLYATLHDLDRAEVNVIIVELPPDEYRWLAVRDRLRRGASVWDN